MHGRVITDRKVIIVCAPYHVEFYIHNRPHKGKIKDHVLRRVNEMFIEEGMRNPNCWWNSRPYEVSVREDYTTRGEYIYTISPKDGDHV